MATPVSGKPRDCGRPKRCSAAAEGSHGVMALDGRTAIMAKDYRSHSTFDQAQAKRETTGTLPIRERSVRKETNTLGFVGATSSATQLPLGDTKRSKEPRYPIRAPGARARSPTRWLSHA